MMMRKKMLEMKLHEHKKLSHGIRTILSVAVNGFDIDMKAQEEIHIHRLIRLDEKNGAAIEDTKQQINNIALRK